MRIGELEIALRILQQEEALCLELGNRNSLAYCYWYGAFSRAHSVIGRQSKEKLSAALDIFTTCLFPFLETSACLDSPCSPSPSRTFSVTIFVGT
jgi:hypothetical protein